MGTDARQRKFYGPRGLGQIRMLPVKTASKPSTWKEIRVNIDDDGLDTRYDLDPEDVTRTFGDWQLQPIKDVYIELTPEQDDIRSIRPWEGRFLLTFDRFAARVDPETDKSMAPTIKHKSAERVGPMPNGATWTNPPHEEFYAILKIVGSEIGKKTPFDGMEAVKSLVYQFERNGETGLMEIVWERKFWYTQLENFLTVAGYDYDADTLTPSENVLGELQDILSSRGAIFRGTFENGWLQRDLEDPPIGVTVK